MPPRELTEAFFQNKKKIIFKSFLVCKDLFNCKDPFLILTASINFTACLLFLFLTWGI